MRKRFLSIMLVLVMLLSFIPVISNAATSGTCGENITWTLDDNGTLTISGTGAMANYDLGYSPFHNNSEIKTIVIKSGVTSIGNGAFSSCTNLTYIEVPDSITTIGDGAFYFCTNLTNIQIPDSVRTIDVRAFSFCENLTSIEISDRVTTISNAAFYYCTSLTSIKIPDSVTTIGDNAFEGCTSLTNIQIPDNVTTIGVWAFHGCSNLTNIQMPDNVTTIGSNAFWGTSYYDDKNNWEDGVLYVGNYLINADNDKISSKYEIKEGTIVIAENAFFSCTGLTSIEIPDSVISIGDGAFAHCERLTDIEIPNSVTSIDDEVFTICTSLTRITISDSIICIGENAFYWCDNLTDIYYSGTKDEWNSIEILEGNESLTTATIHYNNGGDITPTPLPTTTAEITKSETNTSYNFDITPAQAYENCYVYVSIYGKNNALLAVNRVSLELTGKTNVSIGKKDSASLIKVFIWADTLQPVIDAKEFVL